METSIDRKRGFITARLSGSQTRATLEAAFNELVQHRAFDPSLNRLWDVRTAGLGKLNSDDLRCIRGFIRGRPEDAGTARVAVLVSEDVDYGIGNMFRLMSEGVLPVNIRAFRDLDEAEAWVSTGGDPRSRS